MDPRAIIAQRIDLQLRRHLRQGIDTSLALRNERYALDVLLVCDAMQGTDLPLLARQFRVAGERMAVERAAADRDPAPSQPWAADTSGFGMSLPPKAATAPPRRWFGLSPRQG